MASLVQRPGGGSFYIQYRVSGKLKRKCTGTDILQIRIFESAQARGQAGDLPTRTPVADVLTGYVEHARIAKKPKSVQTDIYYLRDAFGPICEALRITSRKISGKAKKRPPKPGQDRRRTAPVIEASHFEAITTAQISEFITGRMTSRGLAPKTGNRIRDTLSALFSWAMSQRGIRMLGDKNPAHGVKKYELSAPEIEYLMLEQVAAQLDALADNVQLQAMVATLIYAGVRREELTWLRKDDVELSEGKHGVLHIRAKTVGDEFWEPKTKRNRTVPISSALRHYLDKWRMKAAKGDWFFPTPTGVRWDPDNFALRDTNVSKKIGYMTGPKKDKLAKPFGCLHFRHTFGSQLAQRGESLYKIATLMGNSPDICRLHYARLATESLIESVEFPAPASAVNGNVGHAASA
jgi:integrase